MERTTDGRILVATDSSFLINFLVIDRVDILRALSKYAFRVPNHVSVEITYEDQRDRFIRALEDGTVVEIELTEMREIETYAGLRRFLGDGEAACLAAAVMRRWVVAADEMGRFRREVHERLGSDYWLDTRRALVEALQLGFLTAANANGIRDELRRNRFAMPGPPFEA